MFFRSKTVRGRRSAKTQPTLKSGRTIGRRSLALEWLEERAMLSAAPPLSPNLGVLLVDQSGSGAANLSGNANVTVTHGDFALDSTSSIAAALSGNGHLTASDIYLAGRVATAVNSHLTGTLDTGWAGETDPLAGLAQPSVPSTSFTSATINGRSMTLSPGAYIDAVTITGNSNVTLLPGLYYFEHGITISGNAKVTGNGVMIYNASGAINLSGNAAVTISAPTTGTYAGIALFQNRADSSAIAANSNATLKLTGELYAPDATLNLSGNAAVTIVGSGTTIPGTTIPGAAIVRDLVMSGNGHLGVTLPLLGDLSVEVSDNVGGSSATGVGGAVSAGGTIKYTVTVTNSGPGAATGATVSDLFPSGITHDTLTVATTGGAADTTHANSGSGNIADKVNLPAGSTITYTVTASLASSLNGPFSNTATVAAPAGFTDTNSSNNSATDTDNHDVDVTLTQTDNISGTGVTAINTDQINTLHQFTLSSDGDATDGVVAFGSKLYGELPNSGTFGRGEVFSVNTDGTDFTVLYSFGTSPTDDLDDPSGGLTLSADGSTLYGVAQSGVTFSGDVSPATGTISGPTPDGAIFSLSTNGTNFKILHTFDGTDGKEPLSGLALSGSTLYGTATNGGANGDGDIFKINTDGSGFAVLASFDGFNGYMPSKVAVSGSTLYGATAEGGPGFIQTPLNIDPNGFGVVYSISTSGGSINILHAFDGADGNDPSGGLTISGPTLYGASGSSTGAGQIFQIQTDGSDFGSLYSFSGSDGDGPNGNLVLSNSVLYGTTFAGGTSSNGTVFAISTSGTLLAETSFGTTTNLVDPFAGVTLVGSKIFGTTSDESGSELGGIFAVAPAVVPGTSITYTVTVANQGPMAANGVNVADLIGANTDFTADSYSAIGAGGATGFSSHGSGSIADVVNLPSGSSITYTITAAIDPSATGALSNTATATVAGGLTNTNPASIAGTVSATDTDFLTPQSDLSVAITDSDGGASDGTSGTAYAGSQITYTLTVSNSGPSTAAAPTYVADTFSNNPEFANDSYTTVGTLGAGGFTASGVGDISDGITLLPGSSITYTIVAQIAAGATGSISDEATAATANSSSSATDSDTLSGVNLVVSESDSAGGSDTVGGMPSLVKSLQSLGGYEGSSGLVQFGSKLYGTANVYDNIFGQSLGEVYSINTDGTGFTVLATLAGNMSLGNLAISADGSTLYGMSTGTVGSGGEVFSVSTAGGPAQVLCNLNVDSESIEGGLTLSGSKLYGTIAEPNVFDDGDIFSVNTDGSGYTVLASFNGLNGFIPASEGPIETSLVVFGSTIYGVTKQGGPGFNGAALYGPDGDGVVFSLSTSGGPIKVLHAFDGIDGNEPSGTLSLVGSTLYGLTSTGGQFGDGELYKINSDGSGFGVVFSFNGLDGSAPTGNLYVSGNTFYGATNMSSSGSGMVFAINTAGSLVGETPTNNSAVCGVTLVGSNILFATASGDSDPPWYYVGGEIETFSFPSIAAGSAPGYTITVANNGPDNAYGVKISDLLGANADLTSDTFTASATGGATGFRAFGSGSIHDTVDLPAGSSIQYIVIAYVASGATGMLNNTVTAAAGPGEVNINPDSVGGVTSVTDTDAIVPEGSVPEDVQIEASQTDSAQNSPSFLYGFDSSQSASSALTQFGSTFYGVTSSAIGSYNPGEVFSINADGTGFTVLHAFEGFDGQSPTGKLAISADGSTLYGTTTTGGENGHGEVFSVGTDGSNFTILYSFGYPDYSPLGVTLSGTTLYGTARSYEGGLEVFSVGTDGSNFTVLATIYENSFGAQSQGTLVVSGSMVYGTDYIAGGDGEVFSIDTSTDNFTVLHSFSGSDGNSPEGGLTLVGSTLYGTAELGGAYGNGVLFSVNTDGSDFTDIYSFNPNTGPANPTGDMVLVGSTFYGIAGSDVFAVGMSGSLEGSYSEGAPLAGLTFNGSLIYFTTTSSFFYPGSGIYTLAPPQVTAGGQITYEVTISNNGPSNAVGLSIADALGANTDLTGDTFTASGTLGATGFTASGSGSIADVVNLPSGASIFYTIVADIASNATGTLSNTAAATVSSAETNTDFGSVAGTTSVTDNDAIVSTSNNNSIASGTIILGGTLQLPSTPNVSDGTLIVPIGGTIALTSGINGLTNPSPVSTTIDYPTLVSGSSGALPYTGVITVGSGETLSAKQILAGSLVIDADSTVTIAPSLEPPA